MGTKKESTIKSEAAKATPKPATRKTKAPAAKAAKPAVIKETLTQEPAAKSTPKPAPKKAASKAVARVITRDDIALRAYYIAEKRHKHGIPGDSAQDWLEAERELIAEQKTKKPK